MGGVRTQCAVIMQAIFFPGRAAQAGLRSPGCSDSDASTSASPVLENRPMKRDGQRATPPAEHLAVRPGPDRATKSTAMRRVERGAAQGQRCRAAATLLARHPCGPV